MLYTSPPCACVKTNESIVTIEITEMGEYREPEDTRQVPTACWVHNNGQDTLMLSSLWYYLSGFHTMMDNFIMATSVFSPREGKQRRPRSPPASLRCGSNQRRLIGQQNTQRGAIGV